MPREGLARHPRVRHLSEAHRGRRGDVCLRRYDMTELEALHELQAMLVKLFETAQKLPPGLDRDEVLKEINLMRLRLDAIARGAEDRK